MTPSISDVVRRIVFGDEGSDLADTDHAPRIREQADVFIGRVAHVGMDCLTGSVRYAARLSGGVEEIGVRSIDEHADLVHPLN